MTELQRRVRRARWEVAKALILPVMLIPITYGAAHGGAAPALAAIAANLLVCAAAVDRYSKLQDARRALALNPPPAPLPTTVARYRSGRAGTSSEAG